MRWGKSYMDELGSAVCAICGEERLGGSTWFLVAEYRWDDKLKILHWSDYLAAYDGVEAACSTAHVRELVVHWMTTGSLRYPFARALYQGGSRRKAKVLSFAKHNENIGTAREIGELAVHRESLERALAENPLSLDTILDALLCALERECGGESEAETMDEQKVCSV